MVDKREKFWVEKTVYQWITVRGGVRVNRGDGGISLEVGGILLYDFLSFYIPNCY
jgi:hypothetical protein